MTDYVNLKVSEAAPGIVVVAVNRPDQLNALNPEVLADLKAAADALKGRDDLRVVILTGEGRAFVAGADIKSMAGFAPEEARAFAEAGHAAMDAIAALDVPVIAAINGFALGGGLELALSADLLYASEKAKLGLPEVTLGIVPGFGGTQRLGRVIGWHAARDLVFSGRTIGAEEALRLGLVCQVLPQENFLGQVVEIAQTIASRGPVAVRVAKRVMREGSEQPLAQANATERGAFVELWETHDRKEGMAAFVDKRAAGFLGR